MKYQNFIMRVLCLILILGAVIGYNSMEKKETESSQIAELTARVEDLEKQQKEMLTALEEAAKAQEEAKVDQEEAKAAQEESKTKEETEETSKSENADAEDKEQEDLAYQNGTYTGEGQGFGGTIQVEVTLENDTITDIQVVSAPGEDSAYLSQGEGVISTILAAQSTDVDTISGATFSSTGIINAVNDALGKAENK